MQMDKIDVLIIDDEEDIREIISDLVVMKGFSFKTASNGAEALDILESHVPALVICDISMPGIDGLELLEKVKMKGLYCPFVMITAHEESSRVIKAMQLGCIDYLVKPFKSDEFLIKLESWVEVGKRIQAVFFERSAESSPEDISRQLRMIELFKLKNVKLTSKPE